MNRFNICQAYAQLEADYNVGGWLRERPSNQRRMESIGCQLLRMGFSNPYGWVDIEGGQNPDIDEPEWDSDDEDVREIYMSKVLEWGLPISDELMVAIRRLFTAEHVAKFPQCASRHTKELL